MHLIRKTILWPGLLSVLLFALIFSSLPGEDIPTPVGEADPLDPDHRLLSRVLADVVGPDGVDYAALQARHRKTLDLYRIQLARTPWPEDATSRMALLINAYNAFTLALVVDRLPEDRKDWPDWSIRRLDPLHQNPWLLFKFELAGRWITLDQIEQEYLRPMGDPRIHFALNCASRSCPPLRPEAYLARQLETQLAETARNFATSPENVRTESGKIVLNPILDWFKQDFGEESGVRSFLRPLATETVQTALQEGIGIFYFDYDWRLNLAPNLSSTLPGKPGLDQIRGH